MNPGISWRVVVVLGLCGHLAPHLALGAPQDWISRSDANTELVSALFARYLPEIMSDLGVMGLDGEVRGISQELDRQARQEEQALQATLRSRLAVEEHPEVAQDLKILIDLLARDLRETEVEERLMLPYFDVAETVFRGLRGLLDEQIPVERRAAALVRLRRYAGLEAGYVPLAEQAEAYTRARLSETDLLGPFREEVEKDLARAPRLVAGIGQMFDSAGVGGYVSALEALGSQLDTYHAFVEQEVLPRAREDYRLPPELYALRLEDLGVDMTVAELTSRAKVAFKEIQNEMAALAELLAESEGWPSADYRDVVGELKKQQLTAESIVEFYTARIEDIETIIEREHVTTLPKRGLRLRLATEAEEAMVQAATIRWPQLLGEAAEVGEIILPVRRVSTDDASDALIDDFTFEAAAWSLIVHEGRPGHELQMASILERGVSKARAFYAFNSTNIEGWALYAESEMKPYLPLDAQLISLQHRLLRAARAYLDPGMQTGEIMLDEAMRVLTEDVVVSVPLAEQEVERYTSRNPGQATSYFCGYSRWLELRADTERLLGESFNRQAFNDFLLSQGLLPPKLMREAVMREFVPAHTSGD
jgi:hypothetical protein